VATGESYSVREFVELAFGQLGLDWQKHVERDPRYLRPTEVDALHGDPSKAERVLGWKRQVSFPQLVEMMVASDHALARQERLLHDAGHAGAARGAAQG
jgi:GDPmannose 4,6-dehydratase